MRLRLTVAILLLVAATLLVTTVSSYYLIRRAAVSTEQRELDGEAQAISKTFSSTAAYTTDRREFRVVKRTGDFEGINVVALFPNGTIVGQLPSGLTVGQLDVPTLQEGKVTSGHDGALLVYSAVPLPVTKIKQYTPILVVTRQAHDPANGLRYFGLVGVIGLAVAALVAVALARRFTRPLVSAVHTTGQIASGDRDARMTVGRHELPEFAQLAESINSMAASLARARDQERQFLLSVSHELRTPLTSIRGYADAVMDGATDDPVGAAHVISAEAGRLERLVQDLLDLARLDANRFSLDLQAVDAGEVVQGVVEGFQHRARELGLELTSAVDPRAPVWVFADTDRLGQVIANLIENAASFAENRIVVGAGSVTNDPVPDNPSAGTGTGWGAVADPAARTGVPAIWVVDDGPGIRPDELPLVFDRHYSSDRGLGRRQGLGLGLAIVSELAGAMGATVRADSPVAEGRGTRMVVWLRAAPAPPAPTPSVDPGFASSRPTGEPTTERSLDG
jgi:signal transduction histidine kinase